MRDCPKCGAPVDGVACPTCGHGQPKQAKKADDAIDRRCPRCGGLGVFSTNTNGSGPWYCREHSTRSVGGSSCPPPGGFASLREILRHAQESLDERAALRGE